MSIGDTLPRATLESRNTADALDAIRSIWGGTSTHSTNAYTITTTIKVVTLLTGEKFRFIPDATNTGAATLTIKDPLGTTTVSAVSIKRADGSTALSAGDLPSGIPCEVTYDGTNFRLTAVATSALVTSGTYSPTFTSVANLDSTPTKGGDFSYLRVGSIVSVSGYATVDPTTPATITQFGVSLPVTSNLAVTSDLTGLCAANAVISESGGVFADTTNDRANVHFICNSVTSHALFIQFQFSVI